MNATGLGPLPGDDAASAVGMVLELVPELPFLPSLPARGPGADAVGRTASLLVDLHVDLQPGGWRLVDRPGRDERRARDTWRRDLDALHEEAGDWAGPLKVAVLGPCTLAAEVLLFRGEKALADTGATSDLADSLAEGLVALVADVRRMVPGADPVVVQLDEPRLPAVLAGDVPSQSGWGRLRVVDAPVAQDRLRAVLAATAGPSGVRCPSPSAPVALVAGAGAAFLSLDAASAERVDRDELGEAVDGGMGLHLGLVPATDVPPSDVRALAAPALDLWRRLSFPPERLGEVVTVTHTDGLEACSPSGARQVLRRCREVADALAELAQP